MRTGVGCTSDREHDCITWRIKPFRCEKMRGRTPLHVSLHYSCEVLRTIVNYCARRTRYFISFYNGVCVFAFFYYCYYSLSLRRLSYATVSEKQHVSLDNRVTYTYTFLIELPNGFRAQGLCFFNWKLHRLHRTRVRTFATTCYCRTS